MKRESVCRMDREEVYQRERREERFPCRMALGLAGGFPFLPPKKGIRFKRGRTKQGVTLLGREAPSGRGC